jgi:acetyl esterase/lipase
MLDNHHLKEKVKMKDSADDTVKMIPDLVYATSNGKQLLADLYLPENSQHPLPVIIWLHGGGWRFGDRKLGPDFSVYFASKGFAMVSIDYRLSDETIFPNQIYDVKTAIRWVKTISENYGLDRNKIGIWGSSAGGHLAGLTATSGSTQLIGEEDLYSDMSNEVQAVAIGYGPIDFLQIDEHLTSHGIVEEDPESVQLPTGKKSSDSDSFESLLLGAPIHSCPERVMQANPITYIKSGMPPFLIMHGLSDTAVPSHQSELLYHALAAEGNNVSLYLIKGLGHGFLNRTHLDEGGARVVNFRTSYNREERIIEETPIKIFETIEEFFRRNLS